jgi:hypothetical protein
MKIAVRGDLKEIGIWIAWKKAGARGQICRPTCDLHFSLCCAVFYAKLTRQSYSDYVELMPWPLGIQRRLVW